MANLLGNIAKYKYTNRVGRRMENVIIKIQFSSYNRDVLLCYRLALYVFFGMMTF